MNQNSQGGEVYYPQDKKEQTELNVYEDPKAMWCLFFMFITVIAVIVFSLRVKSKEGPDAKEHPFHMQYHLHKENKSEIQMNKEVCQ